MKLSESLNKQIIIHAIGDLGVHELLNLFDKLRVEFGERDRRLRIEHTQHVDMSEIDRFDDRVIASMQ